MHTVKVNGQIIIYGQITRREAFDVCIEIKDTLIRKCIGAIVTGANYDNCQGLLYGDFHINWQNVQIEMF